MKTNVEHWIYFFTINLRDPLADFILSVFAILGFAGKETLIPGG